MFHFTPLLKSKLIASQRIAEAEERNIYPDHDLVRACRALSLDLPGLRRTVVWLGLSTERLRSIESAGLAALPALDRDCWDAFLASDCPPKSAIDMTLGGCFAGIGWFEPDNDPASRVSARWLGGVRVGSVFVRVDPARAHDIRVTAHHVRSLETARALRLTSASVRSKRTVRSKTMARCF